MIPSSPQEQLHLALLRAAHDGNLPELQKALTLGADPHTLAPAKMTPLLIAARNGHADCVSLLLPLSDPLHSDYS